PGRPGPSMPVIARPCPGADAAPVTVASTAATRVAAVTVARPGNGCYQWPRERPARFLLLLVLLSEPTGGGRGTRVLKFNRTHPESRQRTWRLFCCRHAGQAPRNQRWKHHAPAHRRPPHPQPRATDFPGRAAGPDSLRRPGLADRGRRAPCAGRDPARPRRPPRGGDRTLLDPRPGRGDGVRAAPASAAREPRRRAGDRDAGVLREAAHHRRLEGPDQRP